MAALQKIRNRAGLLIAALGVALVCFVLGDLLTSGSTLFNKFKDNAFSVDGDVVSTGEYSNRINQFEEFQKIMSGQNSLDENISGQIREFVYQQMVKEKMLDDQAEKLGLAVSTEELNDLVHGENISPVLLQSPLFVDQQTRQFNKAGLQNFLTFVLDTDVSTLSDDQKMEHYRLYNLWMLLERMIKYNRLEEKYNALVMSGISANNIEAQANLSDANYNATVAYVLNRYSLIPDSAVSVSDKEIEKLYNERKNNFKMNGEEAEISFFTKDVVPSEEDYAAVEAEMEKVTETLRTSENPALVVADHSDQPYHDVFFSEAALAGEEKLFAQSAAIGDVLGPIREDQAYLSYKLVDRTVAPDSVKMRMISLPFTDEALANSVADSLLTVIKGGKEFATVANEINPQTNGGEVGWVTEITLSSLGNDFVEAIFDAPKGDLLKLKVRNATQLVQIEDKTNPVPKVKLAVVEMSVPVSDRTIMNIDNELNQFVAENVKASDFEKAALEKGYNLVSNRAVIPSNPSLDQIIGSRQVISWVFNDDVGSIKKFDLTDQRVVAAIKNRYSGEYAPVSMVSDYLKTELLKDKKAEKMIADLKAKNLTTLSDYAGAMNASIDTVRFVNFATTTIAMLGREPSVNVCSKYDELNKAEGPLKGNNGVLVMTVTSREDAPNTQSVEDAKLLLDNSYNYRLGNYTNILESLKPKMDVKDNRVKFY